MFLSERDWLAHLERYKDLLREAEQERLICSAGLRQPGILRLRSAQGWSVHHRVVGWIGEQMVRWGWILQRHGTTPPPCCPQVSGGFR